MQRLRNLYQTRNREDGHREAPTCCFSKARIPTIGEQMRTDEI